MKRSYPMEDLPNEAHDHPHHRSLWFSHGDVNQVDFWGEMISYKKPPKKPVGEILHDKIIEARGGADSGAVTSSQKWVHAGQTFLKSVQTLRVYNRPESERVFDFDITITAPDKEVVLGDTKEGSVGLRIAESMRLKGVKGPGQGHILNSEGLKDVACWGQKAKWVDMFGPIGDKIYGFAFMDHPKNRRHPNRWHARDYGLFAANPFCEGDMDKTKAKGDGDLKLAPGQSATFKYRILIHEGEADPAKITARYQEYVQSAP